MTIQGKQKRNRVEIVVEDIMRTSYAEFARLVGVTRFRVANWKRRGGFPSKQKTIEMLSKKTGLPPKTFVD